MSKHRQSRFDKNSARLLLDGDGPERDRLTSVICAAATPGRPRELAGEDAVIAAFRQPRAVRGPRWWSRGMPLRIGVVALALTAAGGAALAGVMSGSPTVAGHRQHPSATVSATPTPRAARHAAPPATKNTSPLHTPATTAIPTTTPSNHAHPGRGHHAAPPGHDK